MADSDKSIFANMDKKTKIQFTAIAVLIALIAFAALMALMGRGKNPVSPDDMQEMSGAFSGSYDPLADVKYEDQYLKRIEEYDDVVIPESDTEDRNYFKETLFVGDSNTEGLAAYNHLSLQQVLGMTGMPIQAVTSNKCMWFVGYEEPVTIPVAVGMLKPRRIIINFGTNNAGGTDTENFIYYYETALNAIEKAYPYADIIVSAVLPVAKERSYPNIKMQDIDRFNLALADMCRERGLKFLNTAEIFKDPANGFMKPEYVAKDGIHLARDGYKALLEYVGSHKHIVPDSRPARGTIPTRRNAPYVPEGSSSIASSSMVSSSMMSSSIRASSSVMSSSSIGVSSALSSSSIVSSSQVHSSSRSSSEAISSSQASSAVVSSSSQVSSSEIVSSTMPENSSEVQVPSSSQEASSARPAVICTYCGGAHTDADHPCEICGQTGHGNNCPVPVVKCSFCSGDHPDQEHSCSACGNKGHEQNGRCPPICGYCSGAHTDAEHRCVNCGQTGHGDTCPAPVVVCSLCSGEHTAEQHVCTVCSTTGHEGGCSAPRPTGEEVIQN